MYQEERLTAILDHLQLHRRINVQEICGLFEVSRDNARRDIVILHERGDVSARTAGPLSPSCPSAMRTSFFLAPAGLRRKVCVIREMIRRAGIQLLVASQ